MIEDTEKVLATAPPVIINGHVYQVVVRELPGEINGMTDPDRKLIIVDKQFADIGGTSLRELILHELIHAIDHKTKYISDCPLGFDPSAGHGSSIRYSEDEKGRVVRMWLGRISEACVRCWSESLFATFTDPRNRDFTSWLFGIGQSNYQFAFGKQPVESESRDVE